MKTAAMTAGRRHERGGSRPPKMQPQMDPPEGPEEDLDNRRVDFSLILVDLPDDGHFSDWDEGLGHST